jgi:hypothetical protein
MDKNKFWLGGRLFNTASRHVRNARPQGKARPQRTSARQGTSTNANARHARNLNARHVRTSATQGTSARPQRKARHVRNARHVGKLGGPTHVRKLGGPTHVRNLGAPTQRKARPQDGRPNAKLIRNENVHTREH